MLLSQLCSSFASSQLLLLAWVKSRPVQPTRNLSQEEWRQRVNEARRRSDDFVANARSRKADPFSADDLRKEAIERARRDPTLRQGDIVATDRGLEMFVGNEESRQPSDFVPVPGSK